MTDISRLFDVGPPHGWVPAVGERVVVSIGGSPVGFVFSAGIVTGHFEVPHFSGNVIDSYRVDFDDGGWLQCSKNSLRPL